MLALCSQVEKLDVLKIDVEDMEAEVAFLSRNENSKVTVVRIPNSSMENSKCAAVQKNIHCT